MAYIVHVNQHVIKFNKKHGTQLPPYRVQEGREGKNPRYCMKVKMSGPSETVYSPEEPLSCGAQIWIETEVEPILEQECIFKDIREEMDKVRELVRD